MRRSLTNRNGVCMLDSIKTCQKCGCLFDINKAMCVDIGEVFRKEACPACKEPYRGEKY